jgi:hypothetical protein
MWARKNKNRPISGFFTKIAYFQVLNFIPVKVSTLYLAQHYLKLFYRLTIFRRSLVITNSLTYYILKVSTFY